MKVKTFSWGGTYSLTDTERRINDWMEGNPSYDVQYVEYTSQAEKGTLILIFYKDK